MPRNRKSASKSAKNSKNRVLNAFDTAVDDEYYIKGLRHQQDIDLDHISDEKIKILLSNQVNSEDDEDIDSDEAIGSDSDISLGESDSEDEDKWGASFDEAELRPLSEIWDLDNDDESQELGSPQLSKARNHGFQDEVTSQVESKSEAESNSSMNSDSDSDSDPDTESLSSFQNDFGLDNEDSSSESDEDIEALRNAIKSVSGNKEMGMSNNKLMYAEEENPFALPQSKADEPLSLQDLMPLSSKAKTLAVPAPRRVQERANRSVAYDLAKQEIGKWADTVAENRQAEHLQFPINPTEDVKSTSPFSLVKNSEQNDLESKINNILQESQLADEKGVSTFEEIAVAKMSIADVKKRRDQLRHMRELMFREEKRAKRIKKIKSKKYRKIHKKERERMAELDGNDLSDDDADRESVEKAERERALERATLRHKNNSKWAKQLLEHGLTRDSGTRAEIEEMLRQSDALRQKVSGNNESSSDEDTDGNLEDEVILLDRDNSHQRPQKGVLAMKFMQDAEDKERKLNSQSLQDDFDSDDGDVNIGRRVYTPTTGSQVKKGSADEKEKTTEDDLHDPKISQRTRRLERGDESVEFRQSVIEPSLEKGDNSKPEALSNVEDNPWIKASLAAKTPGEVKLVKAKKPTLGDSNNLTSKSFSKRPIFTESTLGDTLVREKDMTLQQQDLVKQAFVDDDVVAEFHASKQGEIDEDKDQEVDETLPGWGSWSNEKPHIRKFRKISGINEKQRQDFKKSNVIISEKVNKKAAKYNASAVPFPFENKQQYERSLRMPIGQEWVTKDTFQRQTKPRVLIKRGTVIDPIKKPRSSN